jgi:hypothetical protein
MMKRNERTNEAAAPRSSLAVAAVALLLGVWLSVLPGPAGSTQPGLQLAAEETDGKDKEKRGASGEEERDEDDEAQDEDEKEKKHKSYQGSTEPSY